jgi:zinc protease
MYSFLCANAAECANGESHMSRIVWFVSLCFFVSLVVAQAQKPAASSDLLPFKVTERTLPNGLKVIVVPTGFPNLVSLQIPVQTGSRNEIEPGKSGFAHFFEHMMFRGTKEYPPDVYNDIVTKAGASQNAYTTDDYTDYHITFAKEDLDTILKIEADRFQNLSYPEEAFKTESRAVLGEYNKNSANPISKLFEVMQDNAFTTSTYKHTTMGFLKDIEDMPNQFEYSKLFFDRWYRPEYTTIIVAGDVTADQVMPLIEKYWGGWKRGSYKVEIPVEPPHKAPVYAHVPWDTPTLPWIVVGFHGPAFSDTQKDYAAMDLLMDLDFGPTSAVYQRLVQQEQKVDSLFPYLPATVDPQLVIAGARLKSKDDALYVRDQLLSVFAEARTTPPSAERLKDAISNARYSLIRSLDNTEDIASTVARFVHFDRSYETLNNLFRVYQSLTPADLQAVAQKYFQDGELVVTTLSHDPLPAAISSEPSLASFTTAAPAATPKFQTVWVKSLLPQVTVKLTFTAGSAYDPKGKEGLAALTAAMVAEAGSKERTIDEIQRALYPMAGVFHSQVDKEMSTFTLSIHRDNWRPFCDIVLPMLLDPGFRESDFQRLKTAQLNQLTQDLRSNNEEELGKERLQTDIFRGCAYDHPVVGTVEGIQAITLDDVKDFWRKAFAQSNLIVGFGGDVPPEMAQQLESELSELPPTAGLSIPAEIKANQPKGYEIEIIQKDTRATAISFGHPIDVTRADPDFAALSVARSWLGEHRSSMSHLYQRIRELRGMNYGDYAYIEAFPRGMYLSVPDPNVARRKQIFEIWIRPVVPENAPMALRIALYELNKMIENGLSQQDFEKTRDYLMKNVYLLTATQDEQVGYAIDSKWYGTDEFTKMMRDRLAKLTLEDVNRAIREHLSAKNLSFVIITKDAEGLRQKLLSDEPATITYTAPKPADILAEDKVIGAMKLNLAPENVRITPVDEVFKK